MQTTKGVAKLLCPEKVMILILFASGSVAALTAQFAVKTASLSSSLRRSTGPSRVFAALKGRF